MGIEDPQAKNNAKLSLSDKVVLVSGLAVAGAIPSGLEIAEAVDKYRTENHESIKEGVLDLGEVLNKKFKTGLQVESVSGQYILHIAQLHGEDGATAEQRDKTVAFQKDLEKLIIELKQRYGLTVFFHENRTIEAREHFPLDNNLENALKVYEKNGFDFYTQEVFKPNLLRIKRHIEGFAPDRRNSAADQRYDAEYYYALKTFEQFFRYLLKETLTDEERAVCNEAIQATVKVLQLAESTPGFVDQVYLIMGAPEKLARDGVIVELPAETEEVRANRPKTRFQTFGTGADFHEKRENFSAGLAYDYAQKEKDKYVPIVYGYGHDFTNNIEMINAAQTDPNYNIGLIRIDYKEQ